MSKVLTGSKAALKINGQKVAYIGGVSINEVNGLERINVLDQLESAELAEVSHEASFSCNVFKIAGNSTVDLGITPNNLRDRLTQGELTMELYNSVEDRVEYEITGVKWEGGSGNVDARGVWNGTWNFQGRIGRGM